MERRWVRSSGPVDVSYVLGANRAVVVAEGGMMAVPLSWLYESDCSEPVAPAAVPARTYGRSQQHAALRAFHEAGAAGLIPEQTEHWRRVSELKRLGWVTPTGETRMATTGRAQQVLTITEDGERALREREDLEDDGVE